MALTITEALAEIKTIDARIGKKSEFIKGHLVRQDGLRDPLLKDGGQSVVIAQERQSVADLAERKMALRRAIQQANDATSVTIGDVTRTISDWLVWRRDVLPGQKKLLADIAGVIQTARNEAARKGFAVVTTGDLAKAPTDIIVNADEKELSVQIEKLETIAGGLDGQLSLKNATTMVVLA